MSKNMISIKKLLVHQNETKSFFIMKNKAKSKFLLAIYSDNLMYSDSDEESVPTTSVYEELFFS